MEDETDPQTATKGGATIPLAITMAYLALYLATVNLFGIRLSAIAVIPLIVAPLTFFGTKTQANHSDSGLPQATLIRGLGALLIAAAVDLFTRLAWTLSVRTETTISGYFAPPDIALALITLLTVAYVFTSWATTRSTRDSSHATPM